MIAEQMLLANLSTRLLELAIFWPMNGAAAGLGVPMIRAVRSIHSRLVRAFLCRGMAVRMMLVVWGAWHRARANVRGLREKRLRI